MTSFQVKLEKKLLFNTLSSVVKSLEGRYTTIDLRNESCLTGKIVDVDGFMNVEMEDVIFYDPRGNQHAFETFYIQKRMIRYVHIPKDMDVRQSTEEFFESMRTPMEKPKKGRTFKEKRALQYHKETVNSLQYN